ncbi:STAS domain-containing protein OS=Bosea thiooxidans OX=53254 GN=SAMN05660750_03403 PE=4 SV=1 [Bosea thiooxidans]|uniref:STAS domain-containing protein n=1 Tax=Bosea thiooxidans TaxID=53254 RepID=A0A1T5FNI3_9HYPH|nr:STAS domain-containing protein [Bosea thiooxidans]
MLDASAVAQIDMTAAAMLLQWRTDLAAMGLTFAIAELHKEPREILERAGLFEGAAATTVFEDLEDAVRILGERSSR